MAALSWENLRIGTEVIETVYFYITTPKSHI